jgi:tRNA-2-methylthio-N6-dimethylallyladenosine synthase
MNIPTTEPERQAYFLTQLQNQALAWTEQLGQRPTACVVTFGCQMNERDSEKLAGILNQAGFAISASEEADLVVYNTCTIRDNANQRIFGRLGKLKYYKKNKPAMKIAVCGCMMQESSVLERIRRDFDFIDLAFGTHNIFKFAELLVAMYEAEGMIVDIWEDSEQIVEELPTLRKYPFKSGVNIMFGCNNYCSYCIVPYVRGRERSRPAEDIISEIKRLVGDGVIEVMLLGQNVNSYQDTSLTEQVNFATLLRKVAEIEGLERIRFMTSHPKDLSDELIQVMKESPKICRHLHLPLQSGSTRILEAMNRGYSQEDYLNLVAKIRQQIPDLAITTDIIVGFPGETAADVDETIEVVKQVKFANAFTFIYSPRQGTKAAALPNQVPLEEAKQSFDRLLPVVQESAFAHTKILVGTVQTVLVEEVNSKNPALLDGRLSNNTIVHFSGTEELLGKMVEVKLAEARGYYYMGVLDCFD